MPEPQGFDDCAFLLIRFNGCLGVGRFSMHQKARSLLLCQEGSDVQVKYFSNSVQKCLLSWMYVQPPDVQKPQLLGDPSLSQCVFIPRVPLALCQKPSSSSFQLLPLKHKDHETCNEMLGNGKARARGDQQFWKSKPVTR